MINNSVINKYCNSNNFETLIILITNMLFLLLIIKAKIYAKKYYTKVKDFIIFYH